MGVKEFLQVVPPRSAEHSVCVRERNKIIIRISEVIVI